jgi:hypothetical protein
MVPLWARGKVEIRLKAVVLPTPLGPIRPVMLPASTSKAARSTACVA